MSWSRMTGIQLTSPLHVYQARMKVCAAVLLLVFIALAHGQNIEDQWAEYKVNFGRVLFRVAIANRFLAVLGVGKVQQGL
jgi:hypothetical protein